MILETGEGCDTFSRVKLCLSDYPIQTQYIPETMYNENPICKKLQKAGSVKEYLKKENVPYSKKVFQDFLVCFFELRIKYDFEYFAYKCLTIEDGKNGMGDIPFKLNRGQRRLLKKLKNNALQESPSE